MENDDIAPSGLDWIGAVGVAVAVGVAEHAREQRTFVCAVSHVHLKQQSASSW